MRLIDADALEREGWSLCRTFEKDKTTMVYEVKKPYDFPTIEERKTGKRINHGRWLWLDGVRCSNCNHKLQTTGLTSYCPNCGSDMRG